MATFSDWGREGHLVAGARAPSMVQSRRAAQVALAACAVLAVVVGSRTARPPAPTEPSATAAAPARVRPIGPDPRTATVVADLWLDPGTLGIAEQPPLPIGAARLIAASER